MRIRPVAAAVVPTLALLLAGCGNGSVQPAPRASIAEVAEPFGIAPELVYTADVDGFDLITQAVGPYGSDGFSAIWTRSGGDGFAMVMLSTSRTPGDGVVPCEGLEDRADTAELRCEVAVGGVHVTLAGEWVDAARLRKIAESVHVPSEGELSRLFSELRPPEGPTERGDLPEDGGAPDNSVGEGG